MSVDQILQLTINRTFYLASVLDHEIKFIRGGRERVDRL